MNRILIYLTLQFLVEKAAAERRKLLAATKLA